MQKQVIDYSRLMENALRRMVHDTLDLVARDGMPGKHNLYITFNPAFPGVVMADDLMARYPTEMTIVLEHEFWDLEVEEARFSVRRSFNDVLQKLEIPYNAITLFADQSVNFGIQFSRPVDQAEGEAGAAAVDDEGETDGAEVVTLDQFRKKQ
jgi:hypothetical protein